MELEEGAVLRADPCFPTAHPKGLRLEVCVPAPIAYLGSRWRTFREELELGSLRYTLWVTRCPIKYAATVTTTVIFYTG